MDEHTMTHRTHQRVIRRAILMVLLASAGVLFAQTRRTPTLTENRDDGVSSTPFRRAGMNGPCIDCHSGQKRRYHLPEFATASHVSASDELL
jgi:hypothetical protein